MRDSVNWVHSKKCLLPVILNILAFRCYIILKYNAGCPLSY
jgi:hypothetical protein